MGDSLPERVWCDGCYDMVHFGHANSLRQAKSLGNQLIVGVHSDEEINQNKGPTVFTLEERVKMLRAIKWVDDVVPNAPYKTTLEILDKYRCDFCAHGDDKTTTADGEDAYCEVKAPGTRRYKEVKRTPGVSTTDLVNRILQMESSERNTKFEQSLLTSKKYFDKFFSKNSDEFKSTPENVQSDNGEVAITLEILPSPKEIPEEPGKVVYVSGAFDLFNVGHLDFLEKAGANGDSLIVGLHTDLEVKRYKREYPIMNMYERALSILPCKYVSKVVIGAPYSISESFLQHFKIDLVCHGKTKIFPDENGNNPYSVPTKLGKFLPVDSKNPFTTKTYVDKIITLRPEFEERNKRKEATEIQEGLSELKVY